MDCIGYDGGVTGNKNDSLWGAETGASAIAGDTGRAFTCTTDYTRVYLDVLSGTKLDLTSPCAIEFYVVSVDGASSPYWRFNDGSSTTVTLYLSDIGAFSSNKKVKLVYDGTNITPIVDGTTVTAQIKAFNKSPFELSFVQRLNITVTIRDFKVYSI